MQFNQLQDRGLYLFHSRPQSPFPQHSQFYSSNQLLREAVRNYSNRYQRNYYPIINCYCQIPTPYTIRPCCIPILSPIFTTQCPPIARTNLLPVIPPILPEPSHQEVSVGTEVYTYYPYQNEEFAVPSNIQTYSKQDEDILTEVVAPPTQDGSTNIFNTDEFEYYLKLPKDKFPSANIPFFNTNLLIDEFCKLNDIERHLPWILDLEFGISKAPVSKQIPLYNVIHNKICCKDDPNKIHPDFESCNERFKRIILHYYDCVVSCWYKGYVMLYEDRSVVNFQNWLQVPLQVLGMNWS